MRPQTQPTDAPVVQQPGHPDAPDSAIANGVTRTDTIAPQPFPPPAHQTPIQVSGHRLSPLANGLMTVALALGAGAAGSWAYERFVKPAPPAAEPQASKAAAAEPPSKPSPPSPAPAPAAVETSPEVTAALKSVNTRLDRLEDRIALQSAKPDLAPDLAALKGRVAELIHESDEVDSVQDKVNETGKQMAGLEAELRGLHDEIAELQKRGSAHDRSPDQKSDANADGKPIRTDDESLENSLKRGRRLLLGHKFDAAYDVFRGLESARPDDARVWYLAAVTRGLTSGDWKGETERLVESGLRCERDGHPSADRIDSAVTGLTKETGKDWLEAYRRRARLKAPTDEVTASPR